LTTPYLELPGGVSIPQLGLGTWDLRGETAERAVAVALDAGYLHIDTAEGYGNEDRIGRALVGRDRGSLWITSKVSRDHLRAEDLRRSCEASLRRLGTDYLDLYLIHWPNRHVPVARTIDALLALREEEKIRAWGVSNFTPTHLREALEVATPSTNQVELHPYFRQDELVAVCHEHGVPITAYSPIARGRVFDDEVLREVASAHGKDAAQVALRWEVQRGYVVIPRSSREAHIRSNAGLFDFELGTEEMRRIGGRPQGDRIVDVPWSEFDR
jgi:2,5-diketo-D-gluconate reductase B